MQFPHATFALGEFYERLVYWLRNPSDVQALTVAGNAEVNARLAQIFCFPTADGVQFSPDVRMYAKAKLAGNLRTKANWDSVIREPHYATFIFSSVLLRLVDPPADDPAWAQLSNQAATLLAQIIETHGFSSLTPFLPGGTPIVDCLIEMLRNPGPLRDTGLSILDIITRPYGDEERSDSYFNTDRCSDNRPAVRLLPAVVALVDPQTATTPGSPAPIALQIATRFISDYEFGSIARQSPGKYLPEHLAEFGGPIDDPTFNGAVMAWLERVAAIARTPHSVKRLHHQTATALTAALAPSLYARWRANKDLVRLAAEYTKARLEGAVARVRAGTDDDTAGIEDLSYWDAAIDESDALDDIPQDLLLGFLQTLLEGMVATDGILERELEAPTDDATPGLLHAYAGEARGVGAPHALEPSIPDIHEDSPYTLRNALGFTLRKLASMRPEVGTHLGPGLQDRLRSATVPPREKEAALLALTAIGEAAESLFTRAAADPPLLVLLMDHLKGGIPHGVSEEVRNEMVAMRNAIMTLLTANVTLLVTEYADAIPRALDGALDCITVALTLPRDGGCAVHACVAYDLVYSIAEYPGVLESVPNAPTVFASFLLKALVRTLSSPRGVDRIVITSALPCAGVIAYALQQCSFVPDCVDAAGVAELSAAVPNIAQHTPLTTIIEMVLARIAKSFAALAANQITAAGTAHAAVRALGSLVKAMGSDASYFVVRLKEVVIGLMRPWIETPPTGAFYDEKAELADSGLQLLAAIAEALGSQFDTIFGVDGVSGMLLAPFEAARAAPAHLRITSMGCIHALVMAPSQAIIADPNAILRAVSPDLKPDEHRNALPCALASAVVQVLVQPHYYSRLDHGTVMGAAGLLNGLLPLAAQYASQDLWNWRYACNNASAAVVACIAFIATQEALRKDALDWFLLPMMQDMTVFDLAAEAATDSRVDSTLHAALVVRLVGLLTDAQLPHARRAGLARRIVTTLDPALVDEEVRSFVMRHRQELIADKMDVYGWQ